MSPSPSRGNTPAAWVLAVGLLSGCGAGATATPPPSGPPRVDDHAAARWDDGGPVAGARTLRADGARPAAARTPGPARQAHTASSGRRVNARFDDADLSDALRMLADAAGRSLVVGDGVAGRVTLDLQRVDPLSALIALAEAHGARVSTRGSIVVVETR